MLYRQLGTSDLLVSEIALGSWRTFGAGITETQAKACIWRALDHGINFFDTANVYGRGAAESILGKMLQGVDRSSYILATKLFFPMTENDYGLSRAQIIKQLDDSLKRLQTDYIDLYQCHRYDPDTPLEETMRALTDVVQQGKVRYIGFSEWPADKILAAINISGVERFVSSQPQYSLLRRQPEKDIFPMCRQHSISQIVWAPLGEGVLTGKYLPNKPLPSNSRAAHAYMGKSFQRDFLRQPVLEAVQQMKALATREGLTLAQFAIAWTLRMRDVASSIIGATEPDQITENVGASGKLIKPQTLKEVDFILKQIKPSESV